MPIDHKLIRITEPDDPRRCKAPGGQGQCPYRALDESDFCPRHGGQKTLNKIDAANVRAMRLAKWEARANELANHPQVKGLREEIGILRICLEETVQRCKDAEDIFMLSNKISDLVLKIEKVVSSCHRLEQSTGQSMDKTAALNFAAKIIDVVGKHVTDGFVIDRISDDILDALKVVTQGA